MNELINLYNEKWEKKHVLLKFQPEILKQLKIIPDNQNKRKQNDTNKQTKKLHLHLRRTRVKNKHLFVVLT